MRTISATVAAALSAALAAPAFAVSDPIGDILATFTGTPGADLDVASSVVSLDLNANTLSFSGTMVGAIGSTAGGFYVWGLDRGLGTPRFVGGAPSIGAGVLFDMVVIVRPDGTGSINNLTGGGSVPIPLGAISFAGNTISASNLPVNLFPSEGFTPSNYTWNLWPRQTGPAGNAAVSDFAPDASNAPVVVVPAPASAAIVGLVIAAAARRKRSST